MEASYLNRGDDSIMAVVWDITEKRQQEQALADVDRAVPEPGRRDTGRHVPLRPDGTVLFHNARWSQLIQARAAVGAEKQARAAVPERRAGPSGRAAEVGP